MPQTKLPSSRVEVPKPPESSRVYQILSLLEDTFAGGWDLISKNDRINNGERLTDAVNKVMKEWNS